MKELDLIFKAFSRLFVLAAITVLGALVFRDLWWWFATNTFGVKPLTVPQAWGLTLIVGLLTLRVRSDSEDANWWGNVLTHALAILLFWGEGWAVFHLLCK